MAPRDVLRLTRLYLKRSMQQFILIVKLKEMGVNMVEASGMLPYIANELLILLSAFLNTFLNRSLS